MLPLGVALGILVLTVALKAVQMAAPTAVQRAVLTGLPKADWMAALMARK